MSGPTLVAMPEKPSHCIAADLREAIRSGDFQPDQQLCSGRALMATHGVAAPVLAIARMTVDPSGDQQRVEHLLLDAGHALAYELRSDSRLLHGASSSPLVPKESGQNTAPTRQTPGKPRTSTAAR